MNTQANPTMWSFILIPLITLLASFVGTFTGFGLSTIMVPVMLLFLPLPETLLFVGTIHWFENIWRLSFFRQGFNWRLVATFGIPGITTAFLGAQLSTLAPQSLLSKLLGAGLITYAVALTAIPSFKLKPTPVLAMTGGALAGFFAGLFGFGGAINGAALTAFALPKSIYLATVGAIGIFVDSSRLATYLGNGARLDQSFLLLLLVCVPVSFLGAFVAKKLVGRVPEKKFRLLVLIFILLVGLRLILLPI